jgi:hypothetical protein
MDIIIIFFCVCMCVYKIIRDVKRESQIEVEWDQGNEKNEG